jgi:hypothetical protein
MTFLFLKICLLILQYGLLLGGVASSGEPPFLAPRRQSDPNKDEGEDRIYWGMLKE